MGHNPPQSSPANFQQAVFASVRSGSAGQTEIGALFRQLRRALGLSLPQVASLLQTRIDVISALETGDVQALPDWSETARIVAQYARLGHIDPGPVLSLLRGSLEPRGRWDRETKSSRPKQEDAPQRHKEPSERWAAFRAAFVQPFADVASALTRSRASDEDQDADTLEDAVPSRSRSIRLDGRKTAVLVAALFVIVAYFAQGSVQASLATLHPPIAKLVRNAQNYLLQRSSAVRDGLRWIEVDDPRSRKADKLPVRR